MCGDIRTDETKKKILDNIKHHKIDIVICTPPCQGMSSIGKNRSYELLAKQVDKRNYLILESFPIIEFIDPNFILFENVPRILKVLMPYEDKELPIIDILQIKFGNRYHIKVDIFNCANYGVPQTRERCFIRLMKKGYNWREPEKTEKQITLRDAIGDLPSLEAGEYSNIKNHWARKHSYRMFCIR